MAWKKGPLPPNTWNWGGVVRAGSNPKVGFEFADFQGDHVTICPTDEILKSHEVGWYDNCLELAPETTCRASSPKASNP